MCRGVAPGASSACGAAPAALARPKEAVGLGGLVPTGVPIPFPIASPGCVPPHFCASVCPCSPPLVSQSHRPHACDRAPLPSRVLVLFSGPIDRPDGLASELRALGFEVVEMHGSTGRDGPRHS